MEGIFGATTTVVYGRIDKPNVVIVVKTPAAAVAAAEAHQSLCARCLQGPSRGQRERSPDACLT
jgi:hypothetical protein